MPETLAPHTRVDKYPVAPMPTREASAKAAPEPMPQSIGRVENTGGPSELAKPVTERTVNAVGSIAAADGRPGPDDRTAQEAESSGTPQASDVRETGHGNDIAPKHTAPERADDAKGGTAGAGDAQHEAPADVPKADAQHGAPPDTTRETSDYKPVAYTSGRGDRAKDVAADSPEGERRPDVRAAVSSPEEWAERPETTYWVFKRDRSNPDRVIPCQGPEAQEITKRYDEKIRQVRSKLVRLFPSEERGLDIASVDRFTQSLKIRPVKTIYLPPEAFEEYRHTKAKLKGDQFNDRNPVPLGTYDRQLDIAVVCRDPKIEELNGPKLLQSLAIHERLHGATKRRRFQIVSSASTDSPQENTGILAVGGLARSNIWPGQTDYSHRGSFFNEGLAEYARAKYMMEPAYGRGGWFPPNYVPLISMEFNRAIVKIPSALTYIAAENVNSFPLPALAGAAIFSLAPRMPAMLQCLLYDHKYHLGLNPPELSRKTIDAISGSSLYRQLDRLPYSEGGFTAGYRLVVSALGLLS